jgi:hypothetical protein
MVYIPDDCFNLIKQFAGIYSIGTKWKHAKKLSTQTVLTYFLQNYVEPSSCENLTKKRINFYTLRFQKKHLTKICKSMGKKLKITAATVKHLAWFSILRLGRMTEIRWIALNNAILHKIALRKSICYSSL